MNPEQHAAANAFLSEPSRHADMALGLIHEAHGLLDKALIALDDLVGDETDCPEGWSDSRSPKHVQRLRTALTKARRNLRVAMDNELLPLLEMLRSKKE
jgi:hypothetical protein